MNMFSNSVLFLTNKQLTTDKFIRIYANFDKFIHIYDNLCKFSTTTGHFFFSFLFYFCLLLNIIILQIFELRSIGV